MKNKKEIIRCSTIEAWVKKMIVHHAQDRALNQVTEALDGSGTDDNLILLIGPAGIGKSTIRELLTKLIIDQEAKAMNDDLAYLPVVGIQVIKTPEKRSMWKALTKKTLIALGDPIPENKRVIDPKTGKTAMATLHCVTPIQLMYELVPALRRQDAARKIEQYWNTRTSMLTSVLSTATGRTDLEGLTLDPWQHVMEIASAALRYSSQSQRRDKREAVDAPRGGIYTPTRPIGRLPSHSGRRWH